MSDLTDRLRDQTHGAGIQFVLRDEAADEIERLANQLADVASYSSAEQRNEIERLTVDNRRLSKRVFAAENKVTTQTTECSSYRMAIEQAMDIYTSDSADPARLMYDALGMVYSDDD